MGGEVEMIAKLLKKHLYKNEIKVWQYCATLYILPSHKQTACIKAQGGPY